MASPIIDPQTGESMIVDPKTGEMIPTPPPNVLQQMGQGLKNIIPNAINSVGATGAGLASLVLKGLGMNKASQNVVNTSQQAEKELLQKTGTSDQGLGAMTGNILPYAVPGAMEAKLGAGIPSFGELVGKLYPQLSGLGKAGADVVGSGALNAGANASYTQGTGGTPDQVKQSGLLGLGLGAAVPLAAKGVGEVAANFGGKISGVSPDVIKMAATQEGRDALPEAAQRLYGLKQPDGTMQGGNVTGQALHNDIQSYSDPKQLLQKWPEIPVVNEGLADKTASVQPAIDALEKSKFSTKVGKLEPWQIEANSKIDDLIGSFKNQDENPQTEYPALDVLAKNRELKLKANFDDDNVANAVNAARKKASTALRGELIDAAGGGESPYAQAMDKMSSKLDLLDEMKSRFTNANSETGELAKSGQTLNTLFKPGDPKATENLALLKKFDDMNGSDHAIAAQEESQASQLGPSGTPSLLPNHLSKYDLMLPAAGIGEGAFLHHPLYGALIAAAEATRSPMLNVAARRAANFAGKGTTVLPPYLSNLLTPQTNK